ncbi:fused MFS/spermidine synthase, partial [candidate division TA06 bacterium]|nr:fused MFS/spermidine synthase [candidate division TA06 bacterium]
LRTGRTVGDIYAWGAIGSIVGTFLTGFFLIPVLGTFVIMECIAAVLAGIGLLFLVRSRSLSCLIVALMLLGCIALGSGKWAFATGWAHLFRPTQNPYLLYERESQYTHIKVERLGKAPEMRILTLDSLIHSKVDMRDPADISSPHQYDYIKMYGALTDLVKGRKEKLRAYFLGGGGYVMPRYIARHWPGSYLLVAEIDPGVTEAAVRMLDLPRDHGMHIVHLDARNHVDDLLRQQKEGMTVGNFDVIYGDAYGSEEVPFQLTTFEFNEKLRKLLPPDGIYMLNLIDIFSDG